MSGFVHADEEKNTNNGSIELCNVCSGPVASGTESSESLIYIQFCSHVLDNNFEALKFSALILQVKNQNQRIQPSVSSFEDINYMPKIYKDTDQQFIHW